jgi:hypothetical protein
VGKLEGRSRDALGKDLLSGAHHGDRVTARSGRQAARTCIVDGESACRLMASGGMPHNLRIVRGMRRGWPIEEGVARGGVHRGGEWRWHLNGIRCGEWDPGGW